MGLFRRSVTYITPGGRIARIYADLAAQHHLLIAGATGSGKSVALHGAITATLYQSPARTQYVLIAPKRVELARYKGLPHTVTYASNPDNIARALDQAISIMETRYQEMQRARITRYEGADLYVIIDELADLMTTDKKRVAPMIQRICQLGRAARVHLFAATQCPLASVLPTAITCNLDSRLGLRTRNAQDSRNILGVSCCEKLPRYGQGYYMTADGIRLVDLPLIDDAETVRLISWCTSKHCRE